MKLHYRNGAGRTACGIWSDSIETINNWNEVTCNGCKNTIEYSYYLSRR